MDLIICTKLELENRNKNLILSINILDLEKQSSNNIIEAGLIKYRDCEFLRAFISEEGINALLGNNYIHQFVLSYG